MYRSSVGELEATLVPSYLLTPPSLGRNEYSSFEIIRVTSSLEGPRATAKFPDSGLARCGGTSLRPFANHQRPGAPTTPAPAIYFVTLVKPEFEGLDFVE